MPTTLRPKFLATNDGLRLQSGPGRDLVFKVTGDETGGAFDYFVVEVAPHGGPPLHVHHDKEESIHVISGRFTIRVGDDEQELEQGGFAFMPSGLPHTFLNLTSEPAEIIVVYTPGGCAAFYEELGPLTRNGSPDPAEVAACFERHGMTVLGPPLRA